jgi:hypothetical protein
VALCINGTADRAGACHGDCLVTAEPMTPMFFGYRSDRRPALTVAPHPVLECHRQTKHRVSAMAHLAVVSTNHTCAPSAQAAHESILDADPPAQGVKIARRTTADDAKQRAAEARNLSIKSAFEQVAACWLVLADQMEWIDRKEASPP